MRDPGGLGRHRSPEIYLVADDHVGSPMGGEVEQSHRALAGGAPSESGPDDLLFRTAVHGHQGPSRARIEQRGPAAGEDGEARGFDGADHRFLARVSDLRTDSSRLAAVEANSLLAGYLEYHLPFYDRLRAAALRV